MLSWDGLIGAKMAPRSPNSAVLAMLYRMPANSRMAQRFQLRRRHAAWSTRCRSRPHSMPASKYDCGTRRRSRPGQRQRRRPGRERCATRDGERIRPNASSRRPTRKTPFFDLVGVENLDIGFTNRIRRLRCDGYVGKAAPGARATCPNFDRPRPRRRSHDHCARPWTPSNSHSTMPSTANARNSRSWKSSFPVLHDESLAPAGQHVLSAHVMYVPYKLKGGWTDAAREQICANAPSRRSHATHPASASRSCTPNS